MLDEKMISSFYSMEMKTIREHVKMEGPEENEV